MRPEDEIIAWLQEWYQGQCDGSWEHGYGIRITTLDNPGWRVRIHTKRPPLASSPDLMQRDAGEHDWIRCWVEGSEFHGAGDPTKLGELLREFRRWVGSATAQ